MDRRIEECSGLWAGFWVQGSVRGQMQLTLRFAEGSVFGDGSDRNGTFSMTGTYADSEVVNITKTYPVEAVISNNAAPIIRYRGRWTGTFISGAWWQYGEPLNKGVFELWPVPEAEEERAPALELEIARSLGDEE